MRSVALILACSGVSAFVPAASNTPAKTIMKDGEARWQLGADGPGPWTSLDSLVGGGIEVGDVPWDPLDLAQWRDPKEMRECELANGRSAMLASVGWAWPQLYGLWSTDHVSTVDPVAAIPQVEMLAWAQIIGFCGIIQAAQWNWEQNGSAKPFYDPLSIYPKSAAGQARMQLAELKHARLAMIGFAGEVAHHFIPGSVPGFGSLL